MAHSQPREHAFIDLAADAVAAQHAFEQAEQRVADLRHELLDALTHAVAADQLARADAEVIERYLQEGAFDRARTEFRQRAELEGAHA
ncbi:hypothetical protein [Haloglomus halophilum]|uniref:hypothetical protein n=1 Tax=Haloglomus halophilum TaxID=2962672 RepID=UPI0020C9E6E5|nr:hypothetical protein [Haloglomus halophilum]